MFCHQLFNRGKRLGAGLNGKFQFIQNLRDRARSFFIWTEEKSLITHITAIVGTPVSTIKLRR